MQEQFQRQHEAVVQDMDKLKSDQAELSKVCSESLQTMTIELTIVDWCDPCEVFELNLFRMTGSCHALKHSLTLTVAICGHKASPFLVLRFHGGMSKDQEAEKRARLLAEQKHAASLQAELC